MGEVARKDDSLPKQKNKMDIILLKLGIIPE